MCFRNIRAASESHYFAMSGSLQLVHYLGGVGSEGVDVLKVGFGVDMVNRCCDFAVGVVRRSVLSPVFTNDSTRIDVFVPRFTVDRVEIAR